MNLKTLKNRFIIVSSFLTEEQSWKLGEVSQSKT